ncbi:hypothetical protein N0V82_007208 [Gnomoniopsis sp. IMI 355080]|nr:hypothetical protein N0V82_007208 [Gnomoniopsis sp. IMI 355080]
MASSDPFDDIINLEEKFYSDGHKAGVADGARAGRIEGRSFGIEKGYEKFVEAGRLYGKAVVWANRLPQAQPQAPASTEPQQQQQQQLPALSGGGGARLEKNVLTLHALVEPETLSTENSDEAVNDFDDRVKRAQGKARVVERQVGEEGVLKDGGATKGVQGEKKAASPSTPAPASAAGAGAGVEF